ncbi:Retrovirus-related Pol polyprotein from transposon opus, partial [Mucuna pruriens]
MYPPDMEKTTFMTEGPNYCYRVMLFELKNIGRNLKVYIDGMVLKSENANTHITELEEIFSEIRKHNMQLNLKNVCSRSRGKSLGFMLRQKGIEANLNKCRVIIEKVGQALLLYRYHLNDSPRVRSPLNPSVLHKQSTSGFKDKIPND